jgi:hypothetical protein
MRGLYLRSETPYPPSLREGTFSRKGRREESPVAAPRVGWYQSPKSPTNLNFGVMIWLNF